MIPNCFECQRREQSGSCDFMSACINGLTTGFIPKPKPIARIEKIKKMDVEEMANFLCSLVPETGPVVKTQYGTMDVHQLVVNWLEEEIPADSEIGNIWFLRQINEHRRTGQGQNFKPIESE